MAQCLGDGDSPDMSTSCSQEIIFREPRLFAGHNVWEWIFLSLSILSVAFLITASSIDISYSVSPTCSGLFTFQLVIIMLSVMALGQALYGFICEQQYDMYLHLIFIATAVIYSILICASCMIHNATKEFCCVQRLVFTVLTGVTLMTSLIFALKATTVPDWDEFRIFGASDGLLNMYKQLCYCRALLNWDFQAVIIMVTFGNKGDDAFSSLRETISFALLCAYAMICWISGLRTVLKENKGCVFGTVLLYLGYFAWFSYRLTEWTINDYFQKKWSDNQQLLFYAGFGSALWALIIRVYTLVNLIKSCRNFDHGLSDRAFADLVARESTSLLGRSRGMNF